MNDINKSYTASNFLDKAFYSFLIVVSILCLITGFVAAIVNYTNGGYNILEFIGNLKWYNNIILLFMIAIMLYVSYNIPKIIIHSWNKLKK